MAGLTAWEALRHCGGVATRDGYAHSEWTLLYDAVAAGDVKAFGTLMPEGEKFKDISKLLGHVVVDPQTDIAEGPGGYKFYEVYFIPVTVTDDEAKCLLMLRSKMKRRKRRDESLANLRAIALVDFPSLSGRGYDKLQRMVQDEPDTHFSWNRRGCPRS